MDTHGKIEQFLAGSRFAVVGASTNRDKYGNKVLRCYQQHGLDVVPVHPREREIEGLRCAPDLGSIDGRVDGVSIITPPAITLGVVEQAAELGIRNLWMQPGAESDEVIQRAADLGLDPIADGSCILVVLGYRE